MNDDGFITLHAKTHRKPKKSDTMNGITQQKQPHPLHHHMKPTNLKHSSYSTSTIRFGGPKWTKPSITITPTITTTTTTTTVATIGTTEQTRVTLQEEEEEEVLPPESTPNVPSNSILNIFHSNSNSNGSSNHNNNNTTTTDTTTMTPMWSGQTSQSLTSLMEDYGTYDPNWMKVEHTTIPVSVDDNNSNNNEDESELLGIHNEQFFLNAAHIDDTTDGGIQMNQNQSDEPPPPPQQEPPQQLQEPSPLSPVLVPRDETDSTTTTTIVNGINRLQLHGHAPIHIELVSFGYRYGIPSEIRYYSTGNCYTQPLLPFDTRTILEPIPNYLYHLDGKSGLIKNTMLRWKPMAQSAAVSESHDTHHSTTSSSKSKMINDTRDASSTNYRNVRDYIHTSILPPVTDAIIAAIDIGQHGYVSPITISIYIGSEYGKHRSVATAELTAIALRKVVRTNPHHQFHCPISVGCRHRDIMNTTVVATASNNSKNNRNVTSKKQRALEDDDE